MKLCGNDCHALCDFCKHRKVETDENFTLGNGFCDVLKRHVEAYEWCVDFECFKIGKKDI